MNVYVIPPEPSEDLNEALLVAGVAVTDRLKEADVVIVELGDDADRNLAEARRAYEESGVPGVALADRTQASLLERAGFLSDFLFEPPDPVELRVRIVRLGGDNEDEHIRFKDLEMNTATYQARLAGIPLDLAYMEYELLRFFVQHPRRVWSREQLLSRVWGYDYFGGARTVDVHVRRLRAKLGEERSRWISTVRSVGYRFG